MTSSLTVADLEKNMFGFAIFPPSLPIMAFKVPNYGGWAESASPFVKLTIGIGPQVQIMVTWYKKHFGTMNRMLFFSSVPKTE